LADTIRTVMAGQLYIDPALQDYLRSDAAPGNSPQVLTSREQAVLSAVVEGLANKEIAARVHISEALVKPPSSSSSRRMVSAPEVSSYGSHWSSMAINFEGPTSPRKKWGSYPIFQVYVPELTI
jgi:hypothetical protein